MTIQEMFEQMPEYANEQAIQGVNKTIQFNVTGEEAGQYVIRVADGKVTTEQATADAPDITIHVASDVWKQIASGQLNGAVAFMTGRLKAEGDLQSLMGMQSWFNMPA